MPNEILRKYGTSFIFADVTDFPNSGVGPPTTGANDIRIGTTSGATVSQIDCTNLASGGGARESDKVDLGVTQTMKGHLWMLNACIEFASAPSDAGSVDFYWGSSPNSTAASGNPSILTGSDAGFTDTPGNLGQLIYIGSMLVANEVLNIGFVEEFTPPHRYGMLVIINNADQNFHATVMDETHFILTELIDEGQ